MTTNNRYRCKACGFTIFNRRVRTCESCGADLPAELLFTPEQLQYVAAEDARNEKLRAELAKQAAEKEKKRLARRESGGW